MRDPIRRIPFMLAATWIALWPLLPSPHASAQSDPGKREVLLATLDDAALEDLLATSGFLSLAQQGGSALLVMTGTDGSLRDVRDAFDVLPRGDPSTDRIAVVDFGSMADEAGSVSPEKLDAAAEQLASDLDASRADSELVLLASGSPSAAAEAAGDHLGALVMVEGSPQALAASIRADASERPVNTLTSGSTRRVGIVASPDLAQTASVFAGLGGAPGAGGERIRVVGASPPIDLHQRYVQSKRLTVPIGTAAALFAVFAGALGIATLRSRRSPRWLRDMTAWVAISLPFLALSLLLVGHLPSLTYLTVIPSLIATTAIGTVALVPVARRWGALVALAAAGVILLGGLGVEAALGWTAALTPLLGGSQLDGARFFGLPNAFIGLLLGGSIYVAQRLPRIQGTAVIAAAGLFAGSPWTGSNFGAAVTLFAAAGIWWGLRSSLALWRTVLAGAAAVAAGAFFVVIADRYLTSASTHITTFSENTGGIRGLWEKFVDRLSIGADLIVSNPFALLPVIGVLLMLAIVLRPPGPVRATFEEAPIWRLALLTIVVASFVAYLVEDSGAAALGQGLTTSVSAMLYVSLLRREEMMVAR